MISDKSVRLLQVSAFLCLFARGWLCLNGAEGIPRWIGYALLLGSVAAFAAPRVYAARWLLLPLTTLLLYWGFVRWQATQFQLGMAIEHSLQIGSPLLLFFACQFPNRTREIGLLISSLAALTFIGHGFYAIGIHPVPSHYVEMTRSILSLPLEQAKIFLQTMGFLDFVAAIAIFIPKVRRYGILYLIAWGFLTAMARIVSYLASNTEAVEWHTSIQWTLESIVRTPHWLIPIAFFILTYPQKSNTTR